VTPIHRVLLRPETDYTGSAHDCGSLTSGSYLPVLAAAHPVGRSESQKQSMVIVLGDHHRDPKEESQTKE